MYSTPDNALEYITSIIAQTQYVTNGTWALVPSWCSYIETAKVQRPTIYVIPRSIEITRIAREGYNRNHSVDVILLAPIKSMELIGTYAAVTDAVAMSIASAPQSNRFNVMTVKIEELSGEATMFEARLYSGQVSVVLAERSYRG